MIHPFKGRHKGLQAADGLHYVVAKFLAGAAGVAAGHLHLGIGAGAPASTLGSILLCGWFIFTGRWKKNRLMINNQQ